MKSQGIFPSRAPSNAPPESWAAWMRAERQRIESGIRSVLRPSGSGPASLRRAMRYAVFPGGKRLRPGLALLGHRVCGGRDPEIYRLAASLELVHTFTLIHDDLPCMDDDDYRRGRPTCHKVFGEALAVLAGDALLNLAYEALIRLKTDPKKKAAVLASFASAVGAGGVLGGQVWDIEAEGIEISRAALHQIHLRKTASLITASLRMGGELAGAGKRRLESLDRFGRQLGLLFQLADDLLNVEASAKVLGRPAGGDERLRKATYPRLLGSRRSHERLKRLVRAGRACAFEFGPWSPLFEDLVIAVASRVPKVRRKEEA